MEDNLLIKRCQSGDKSAFQQLIAKYHPYVYRFLLKITSDEQLSEDLTQETFIKVIRSIDKFNIHGSAKFSTYIITLCKNTYIDYYRREKRNMTHISLEENLNIDYPSVDEIVMDKLLNEKVAEGLEKLPEDQKIVIKLKYMEGLTLKEIGEKLELEPKTIKSRIHNGIVKLRNMFGGGD